MFVYMITNLITERAYIGQTIKSPSVRLNEHFDAAFSGSDALLHRTMRDYPQRDVWDIVVLQTCDSAEDLNDAERRWIEYCSTRDSAVGYNVMIGGGGGAKSYSLQHLSNNDDWSQQMKSAYKDLHFGIVERDDATVQLDANGCNSIDEQTRFEIAARKSIHEKFREWGQKGARYRRDMSPEEIEKFREWGRKGAEISRQRMLAREKTGALQS